MLIPTLYFSYLVGQDMYYDYIVYPKLKGEDHYIAPTRWQDFAFLTIYWTVALVLFFASFLLVRHSLKPRPPDVPSKQV